MDHEKLTSGEPANEPGYRYHRWRKTVIRDRRVLDVEALTPAGWAYDAYALDALTGMGEDMYSCGEWCDEITETEAAAIADGLGLSLAANRVPKKDPVPIAPRSTVSGGFVTRFLRRGYRQPPTGM